MFDTYLKVDYRQLMPSGSEDVAENPNNGPPIDDFGVYEDEESRVQRNPFYMGEADWTCPVWIQDKMPTLSLRERLLGCATCMICGYILGFGSFVRLLKALKGNPVPLVVNVTVGNLLTLCGTCFLTGPQQQARRMFHKSRKIASTLYLGCMGLALILLMLPPFSSRGFWLVLLLVAQYAAITWYCLSYIPFARDIMKRMCRRVVNRSESIDDF